MKKRLSVFFEGHVQGVGFRYTTQQIATGYEVAGMVENLPDGRVSLIVEGQEEELSLYLEAIGKSPLSFHIERQEVQWEEARGGLAGFRITR